VAKKLTDDGLGVVGVPKTIDKDPFGHDYTFASTPAVMIATEAIDRVRTTAESHHRALVVEVMGRHAGWIALHAGMAGGANVILVPEREFDIAQVASPGARLLRPGYRADRGDLRGCPAVGGAESLKTGELDAFGHIRLGGIRRLAGRGDREAHRHRDPLRSSWATCSAVARRRPSDVCCPPGSVCMPRTRSTTRTSARWSRCTAPTFVRVPLAEAVGTLKTVPPERMTEAEVFFG